MTTQPGTVTLSRDGSEKIKRLTTLKTEFDAALKAYHEAEKPVDKLRRVIERALERVASRVSQPHGILMVNAQLSERLEAAIKQATAAGISDLHDLRELQTLWADEMGRFQPIVADFNRVEREAIKLGSDAARAVLPALEKLRDDISQPAVEALVGLGVFAELAPPYLERAPRIKTLTHDLSQIRRAAMLINRTGEAWQVLRIAKTGY